VPHHESKDPRRFQPSKRKEKETEKNRNTFKARKDEKLSKFREVQLAE